jgi:hypothetical protein
MQIVAIDFSLNSPGIVIRKKDKLNFISYIKAGIGTKAETKMQEELAMLEDIILQFQPTFTTSKDFSDKEISKLQRFITMANDMILLIEQHVSVKDPIIFGFEGVSYGSGGGGTNNLIDLAAAAAIFKYCLLQKFKNPKTNIVTVAPTTIKKHAGNGRLKKRELWDVFVKNELNDSLLEENSVWDFAKNLEIGAKVPKPFDDLIDAYFLASYLGAL